MSDAEIYSKLRATGISFAGLQGAWWLAACEPFVLPAAVHLQLQNIARAIFTLLDVVNARFGVDTELTALLTYKVPESLRGWFSAAPVLSLRPDFQLCPTPDGFQLVATELEMCPSAHGWAHAMQAAYGLETDLAGTFAHWLNGRELVFCGTQQWSEFSLEQLAFCRALAEHGAQARVAYDVPLETIAREFAAGARWQTPMFGIRAKSLEWDTALLERLRRSDLLKFWGNPPFSLTPQPPLPMGEGEPVIFRFGYLENFAPEQQTAFHHWATHGVSFLNPPTFYLDSKAALAALRLPSVRAELSVETLAVLDACIPETLILREEHWPRLHAEQNQWVLKFSGYDTGQNGWGGRSVQIGAQHTAESWAQVLQAYTQLSIPTVAQRVAHSARVNIEYVDKSGTRQTMKDGFTRLRSFFLRQSPSPKGKGIGGEGSVCGSHLTVSGGTMQVSEATDAVQAPILFR
ncbi:MAG: hypothetical protein JNL09_05285 [Anaerolineales bacterium]|nr:hypothetical protein [Anaerolineales bacterium]